MVEVSKFTVLVLLTQQTFLKTFFYTEFGLEDPKTGLGLFIMRGILGNHLATRLSE